MVQFTFHMQAQLILQVKTSDKLVAQWSGRSCCIHDLDPERAHSIELGTKWELLNERLSLNASVFQTRKE